MLGTKKLGKAPQVRSKASNDAERTKAILLRNELVNGDEEIAAQIINDGEIVNFKKGERIISEGLFEEDVFFILSGAVDVATKGRKIDSRLAPCSIGEMAAKDAGSARTADVTAASDLVECLVISGNTFRALVIKFPSFSANYDRLSAARIREKIAQLGEPELEKGGTLQGLGWPAISSLVGAFVALCVVSIAMYVGVAVFPAAIIGLLSGAMVFVNVLQANPRLRYRNMYWLSGTSLILFLLYGGVSFALTLDGAAVGVQYLIDFSNGREEKALMVAIVAVALLLLALMSAIFDYLFQSRSSN